ncbi:myb family transcription factor PHL5-like [Impatiens glandulifera]|uniref:myb family transcription factor PHL5-like n=1 Tax=Impatiens glandulifera TaxID=253017 RepID=UPI001FB077E8|nr:myb family transcription factor PHL5-like [Impatiens glandulifera]
MKVQEQNYCSQDHSSYDDKLPKFKENRNHQSPNSSFFAGVDSIEQNFSNFLHKDTLQSLVGAAAVTYHSLAQRKSPEISSSKKPSRIKWTQEMHQRFVECVNKLGGSERNNSESTISTSFTSQEHDPKRDMSIMEALRLQVDVQKNLYAQLEIQKQLQLRIEEQGRLLKMMMNQQTKTNYELDKYADSEQVHREM